MTKLELLAPARNLESGMAAIDHGADAVYIGPPKRGARAAAGNSVEDIGRLCTYAHQYGAQVYATVNTIVYDHELHETFQLLHQLSEAGVDAVLVQDMAVAGYVRNHPSLGLRLHASTQTDNRTAAKVSWLSSQGFSRVVLARELSVGEVARIHREQPGVELEVFVHGALCVSYSGLCYASQHCFARSANRGECAQFCRMKFDLLDADGRLLEQGRHLLSLKDLCLIDRLGQLAEAGVVSFKIEGRLKDLAYVKNVTAAYSQQLDRLIAREPQKYCRSSKGRVSYVFTPNLHKSFNRGYTTYFVDGRQPGIASFDTPKATGQFVGTVRELRDTWMSVAGVEHFANGDGLCFFNEKRELEGFRVNRVEYRSQGACRLYLQRMPRSLRAGMRLYRNSDQEFDRQLQRPSAVRKIPVHMSLSITPDGFSLQMEQVSVALGMEHQPSKTPQHDNIVRQLTKLGGTPYECAELTLPDDFNYFIPSSQLAELRRMAVERLAESQGQRRRDAMAEPAASGVSVPPYSPTYLYNIANQAALDYYRSQGVGSPQMAFELSEPSGRRLLMQCRHCLRYALGYCVQHGGQRPRWHEPLSLRLGDGRRFPLQFDCRNCQMNVYAED